MATKPRYGEFQATRKELGKKAATGKQLEKASRMGDCAVESSLSAIAIADTDGYLRYVNPAFVKIWGYEDAHEVLGKSGCPCFAFYAP